MTILVVTGSFDLLHNGHKSIIEQANILNHIISDEVLKILIMATHPIKKYLISATDRKNALDCWLSKMKIKADTYITKCGNEKEADSEFYRVIGKSVNDKDIIIVNGVKENDIKKYKEENMQFKYNMYIRGKKRFFLVSNSKNAIQSSSELKRRLAKYVENKTYYTRELDNLFKKKVIDENTKKLLIKYRKKLFIQSINGILNINTDIPYNE